jgi:hypothetical protein
MLTAWPWPSEQNLYENSVLARREALIKITRLFALLEPPAALQRSPTQGPTSCRACDQVKQPGCSLVPIRAEEPPGRVALREHPNAHPRSLLARGVQGSNTPLAARCPDAMSFLRF